jgi:type VI secretion system secreted protein VgrG
MPTTQKDRRFAITAPNGEEDLLLLREMTVHESVSGLFRIQLTCLSETADIAFDDMIGGALSVRMSLPDEGDATERYFHGVVSRFAQGPPVDRYLSYSAEVVPWLWFLTRGSDCRIFQKMTVPEIVEKVFGDLGMSDYELSLERQYEKREYAVQYRETHYNFVCRLLEEAGIGFFHRHDAKAHTLVLFDDPSAHPETAAAKEATYAAAEDGDRPAGEVVDWVVEQALPSGRYAITDYNMQDPGMDLLADTRSNISVGANDRFEIYDYPGEYATLSEGQAKVKLRMEAAEAASHSIRGRSSRGDFMAGARFDLRGHYRTDFDKTYLLTSVVHQASQSYGRESGETHYANTFTCIPHAVPFRPAQRTPRPVISGAQTATVVGAKGEEIDVDEFGRVVVKFHWDRADARDETSSCRVRVSQAWAGKGWGAVFHPRIGQEVIVEFLEGDPDRPIVTGRVYNGEQTIPFDLPSQKTQSGIQSRSSKDAGTDNFNQIRFEDKKGSEMLSIQAEKDLERLVKNDETDDVQHDRKRNVGNDETVQIGRDRKVEVGNDHEETVGSNEALSVGKNRTRNVGENETIQVGQDQSISIDGARTVTIAKEQKIDVGADQEVSVGAKYQTSVAKEYVLNAQKIQLVADDELSIKVGKAELLMKKSGDITLKGKKINLKGSGDVIIKGSKIAQN